MTEPSSPALIAIWRAGAESALRTISTPVFWSSFWVLMRLSCSEARSRATPPPGTMPSSTAARVACIASSTRSLRSLTATEIEATESKDRVDDAMHATRAAVEEGIVPGGGVALLRASEHLKGLRTKNDDQKTGVEIVRKALSYPARQIAINAGEDGSVIVGKILENKTYAYGFDSQTGEYVNLISKGIIDPTKVVRAAIQNAASVAALLITTEAMVAEVPKKNQGGA